VTKRRSERAGPHRPSAAARARIASRVAFRCCAASRHSRRDPEHRAPGRRCATIGSSCWRTPAPTATPTCNTDADDPRSFSQQATVDVRLTNSCATCAKGGRKPARYPQRTNSWSSTGKIADHPASGRGPSSSKSILIRHRPGASDSDHAAYQIPKIAIGVTHRCARLAS
jgi:hypothetical protein